MPFAESNHCVDKLRSVYTFRILFVENLLELELGGGAQWQADDVRRRWSAVIQWMSTFLAIGHRTKCECRVHAISPK